MKSYWTTLFLLAAIAVCGFALPGRKGDEAAGRNEVNDAPSAGASANTQLTRGEALQMVHGQQPGPIELPPLQLSQRRFREYRSSSYDIPEWKNSKEFPHDAFTFVRIRYNSWGRGGAWRTDYPDSDLNIAYRLQQLTSIKVKYEPHGKIMELTDPDLFNYPFIYVCEPGSIFLSEAERDALRRYLTQGGFMMVDDFWGEAEWDGFYQEIRRVFPDQEPKELPLEHPIFHCVYDLKEKPQIPSINVALYGRDAGITWERPDAREPHYKGLFDDDGRLMAIICHNTDLGDGWEREGEDHWYFREFSEKKAYPLGINIIFYAMTH